METESKKNPQLVSRGTAQFLRIITQWWTIMNIKSPLLGTMKNNSWMLPFSNLKDERLIFLKKFLTWLEKWNKTYSKHCFSADTYGAMYRSTLVMISFIEYSLTELKVPYVLPGKISLIMQYITHRYLRYLDYITQSGFFFILTW